MKLEHLMHKEYIDNSILLLRYQVIVIVPAMGL